MDHRALYFLKIIRWPNLVMTVIAICMHWYFLLFLPMQSRMLDTQMNSMGIFCLGLAFACVMSGGYIINDIFDQDIDKINKGDRQILFNHISIDLAKKYYFWMNIAAIILSFIIALVYHQVKYLALLPLSMLLLYYYSKRLKKIAFVGNLVIAILCGFVLMVPFLFERDRLLANDDLYHSILDRFLVCSLVASLLTLIREIIKDQEDMKGDRAGNAHTLPIIWGEKRTNVLIILLILIIWITLFLSINIVPSDSVFQKILISFMGITLVVPAISMMIPGLNTSHSFRSKYFKYVMALGMIILPIALKTV